MFEPFTIHQAYIINYTLAFLPQMVTEPDALRSDWQALSAFADDLPAKELLDELAIPNIGVLCEPSLTMWPEPKWRFSAWGRPRFLKANGWRFEWLPDVPLPAGTNLSTSLFVHLYPLGIVSVGLSTAVGSDSGLGIDDFTVLLKRMTPSETVQTAKQPWLRIVTPQAFAGMEVSLDRLARLILGEMQKTLFEMPDSAQVVYMKNEPGKAHLRGQNGGVIELVRVDPQAFDRSRHAAGVRGIVIMRPGWQDVEASRLAKYQAAMSWTGRPSAWHYAGGLNTILWNNTAVSERRGRRGRRGYVWRVEAVSELARLEKVLYEYSRDFVVKPAYDQLLRPGSHPTVEFSERWKRLWNVLDELSRVLSTDDLKRAYASHAAYLKTEVTKTEFDRLCANYEKTLHRVEQGVPFHEIKTQALLDRKNNLVEDYQAVSRQLSNAIDEVIRTRLKRQLDDLEREIRGVESELDDLGA